MQGPAQFLMWYSRQTLNFPARMFSDSEIKVALSLEAEHFVVEHGYDPVYGARPLKRFLQKHVETLSAKLILEDQVRQGDTILIDVKDGALTASVQK